jgi:predicted nucleotidyltransferase
MEQLKTEQLKENAENAMRPLVPVRPARPAPADAQITIKRIIERIAQTFDPMRIILFGSYAFGTPTYDSDVDLFVIMPTDTAPRARSIPLRKALEDIIFPADIFVRTPEEFERYKDIVGTLSYTAAHKGKIVYERR